MIATINSPAGIDFSIQKLQQYLYTKLTSLWDAAIVYNSYGRCDRHQSEQGTIMAKLYDPETEGEYRDVYWDDTVDVVSFFGAAPTVLDRTRQVVPVHLVVFCDVKKLKPLVAHRADEEVRLDFLKIIGKVMYGFHVQSVNVGIDQSLKEYRGSAAKLKSADMQPLHVFRINFSLNYNPHQTPLKLN